MNRLVVRMQSGPLFVFRHQLLRTAAVFFLVVSASVKSQALDLARFVLPDESSVRWIAENIEQNGLPMKIQQFRSDKSVEEVLSFYRAEWQDLGEQDIPGYVENSLGEWSIISALDNQSSIVLQIRPGSVAVTEGFVSALNPHAVPNKLPKLSDIPLPPGTQTRSSSSTNDEIRQGTTLLMMNDLSVSANYLFFKDNLPRRGWTYTTGSSNGNTAVLMYSRKGGYCEISISKSESGDSVVMVNRVSSD